MTTVLTALDSKKVPTTGASYQDSTFTLDSIPSLDGKIAIVTGGNTGIGYETVKHLALKGAKVFLAARSKERAEAAIAKLKTEAQSLGKSVDIEFVQVDLSDLKQTKEAALGLASKLTHIDILVNNAGIMDVVDPKAYKFSKDGYESMFATNHLGHFQFTKYLLPVILKTPNSPRIVLLSSFAQWRAPVTGIDFESVKQKKEGFVPLILYGQSKLANILFATEINARHGNHLTINSVHPGIVASELIRPVPYSFVWFLTKALPASVLGNLLFKATPLTTEKGAYSSLYAAASKEIDEKGIKGKYIIPFGVVSDDHHPLAFDRDLAKKLWDFSEDAVSKY
ncbi:UNVERIFIED_CONTAM: hypothetical protein HDU68_009777 [Siphonaria sp. JEL0065]|nr:hypothetical protein HDU68_009777 [Siphonaria sp. JEL0065]